MLSGSAFVVWASQNALWFAWPLTLFTPAIYMQIMLAWIPAWEYWVSNPTRWNRKIWFVMIVVTRFLIGLFCSFLTLGIITTGTVSSSELAIYKETWFAILCFSLPLIPFVAFVLESTEDSKKFVSKVLFIIGLFTSLIVGIVMDTASEKFLPPMTLHCFLSLDGHKDFCRRYAPGRKWCEYHYDAYNIENPNQNLFVRFIWTSSGFDSSQDHCLYPGF
jgi:hypothetical protein